MRKLIALVFNYSLDGLLADKDTEFWKFCFDLLDRQGGPDHDEQTIDFLQSAYAHIMGRTAYAGMAANLPANPDNPWSGILTAGRKVVFSRTLETADWANTTIAAGDTAEEIDKWKAKDPINTLRAQVTARGVASEADFDEIDEEIRAEVAEALEFATDSPFPDPSTATNFIFSS